MARIVLAALLVAATVAQAGSLYFTADNHETMDAEFLGCIETPRYTMSMDLDAIADGKAYLPEVPGAGNQLGCRVYFDYAVTTPFQLDGSVDVSITIGCDIGSASPPDGSVRAMLFQNREEISRASTAGEPACTSDSTIAYAFSLDSANTAFAAGDEFTVGFSVWFTNPPAAAADNLYIGVGPSTPSSASNPGIPSPGAPPSTGGIIYETLAGDEVAITASFEEPTDRKVQYNWTTDASDVVVTSSGTVEAGTATFMIRDAGGAEVASGTVDEDATTVDGSGTPGDWTITVEYAAFQGSVDLAIKPTTGGSTSTTGSATSGMSQSGTTTSGAMTSGTDSNGSTTGGKGSPALPVVFSLAGLAFWAARRR